MKKELIIGVVSALVGAAAVYLLAPQKVEKTVEWSEKIVTVTEFRQVDVVKIVKNDVIIERKVTETKPDKTVTVTEEKIVDKSGTVEQSKEVVKTDSKVAKKSIKTSESTPVFKPFEIIATTNPLNTDMVSGSQVLFKFQPVQAIPFSMVGGVNDFRKINPQVGISFSF